MKIKEFWITPPLIWKHISSGTAWDVKPAGAESIHVIEKSAANKLAECLRIVEFNMVLQENFQDADWKDLVKQALKEYRGENG